MCIGRIIMKKIAIVGTQGVPAQYGGFESLVENLISEYKSQDVAYTVFCSARDYTVRRSTYKGARLKYIPFLHANGVESILYDILSLLCCIRNFDTVLVLGVSGCVFLPIFRLLYHGRLIVNIDGLEHKRAKWGGFARWFLKLSEAVAVRYADVVISDNQCIQDYVTETYHQPSVLIAYGGDHVLRNVSEEKQLQILRDYQLENRQYALSICRIEPENNCHVTLEAFAENGQPLLFIGNLSSSKYGRNLKERYKDRRNIILMDSIYDLDILYTLRKNCRMYIHGHSAGGTNPSLVEAMFFGRPILAYDVAYNRESTHGAARYYKTSGELEALCREEDLDGDQVLQIAYDHYLWQKIIRQYEALFA